MGIEGRFYEWRKQLKNMKIYENYMEILRTRTHIGERFRCKRAEMEKCELPTYLFYYAPLFFRPRKICAPPSKNIFATRVRTHKFSFRLNLLHSFLVRTRARGEPTVVSFMRYSFLEEPSKPPTSGNLFVRHVCAPL